MTPVNAEVPEGSHALLTHPTLDDATQLKELLVQVRGEDNQRGDNGAEALRDLQNWVHEFKEAYGSAALVETFIREQGPEHLVSCLKRNEEDTIVATRALEILAGEAQSNSSVPLLEDGKAVAQLIQLGFVNVVLNALRLPDLQSVGRGLGCRALRRLYNYDRKVVDNIVEQDGVLVLLTQIVHVQRPYAFGILSEVVESRSDVAAKIRSHEGSQRMLLKRFVASPTVFSPASDPAAAKFFLAAWSMSELEEGLAQLFDDRQMAIDSEAFQVLKAASERKYGWTSMVTDVVLPFIDLGSDVVTMVFYFLSKKFVFLYLTSGACAFNTAFSTYAMTAANPPCWKYFLNLVTLGSYSVCAEGRSSSQRGFRTESLVGMKMFASVESMVSFLVGIASLLVAGYIEGYEALGTDETISRWFAVASSLALLPEVSYSIVVARSQHGKKEFGLTYVKSKNTYWHVMLALYQASEIMAMITYVLVVILTLPYGGLYFMGAYLLLMYVAYILFSPCPPRLAAMAPIPLTLIWNLFGGPNSDIRMISRLGGVMRLLSLAWAWAIVFARLHPRTSGWVVVIFGINEQGQHRLVDEFMAGNSLALLIIAAIGTLLHVLCTLQQWLAGRWAFDLFTEQADDVYKFLDNKADADCHAGAVVGTGQDAALVALERWQQVHEFLPSATARVDREAFKKVHEQIMAAAHPGQEKTARFHKFVDALFDAATALMLPKDKKDLGKHCFGYSTLLFNEFDVGDRLDGLQLLSTPAIGWFDPLNYVRAEISEDWAQCTKDANGLVDLEGLTQALLNRHEAKFGNVTEARTAYTEFIGRLFTACKQLQSSEAEKLDKRCFFYAVFFSYEFYFSDARDKEMAQGCGSSTPVADNLGITSTTLPADLQHKAKLMKRSKPE